MTRTDVGTGLGMYVCRIEPKAIPNITMIWTSPGKRNRVRPKETLEKDIEECGWAWDQNRNMATDRQRWLSSVKAFCID